MTKSSSCIPRPSDSDPELLADYGAAIYARLEEPDILNPATESLYEGLLDLYNSSRDEYALLKAILAATLMVYSHDIGRMSTPPTVQPGMTPYAFASNLTEFFLGQELCDRTYTPTEQAMMYLQSMGKEPRYTLATQQLIHELKQVPASIPLPKEYRFPTLPLTVQNTPSGEHIGPSHRDDPSDTGIHPQWRHNTSRPAEFIGTPAIKCGSWTQP